LIVRVTFFIAVSFFIMICLLSIHLIKDVMLELLSVT